MKLLSTILFLFFLLVSPVLADTYGAIAYSESTGKWGYSFDQSSRDAAEQRALGECGARDATVPVWVKNGWAALAKNSRGEWATGWSGNSRAEAEQIALDEIGGGSIVCWVYSGE